MKRMSWGAGPLLTLGFAAACTPPSDAAPKEEAKAPSEVAAPTSAVRVQVVEVRRENFDDRVEATGSIEADRDATLSARASGTLTSLEPLGAKVRKGQVVARIDPAIPLSGAKQAEAGKIAAEAELNLAKQTYDRQKPLHSEGVISDLEFQSIEARYQSARAGLAQAEAALAQARESVENTRLVAPFAGVLDQHFVDEGEQVNPGAAVARIIDAGTLVVKAGLPERYAADVEVGAPVQVRLPAYGLEPRDGRVRYVATAIDPKSRTFEVEVALENRDAKLKPEMVAKLVVTRRQMENVVVVPEDAILRDESGPHVFVVERKGKVAKARRVAVDRKGFGAGRVVVEGLQPGEQVVVVGQTKLIDGDFVQVEAPEGSAG